MREQEIPYGSARQISGPADSPRRPHCARLRPVALGAPMLANSAGPARNTAQVGVIFAYSGYVTERVLSGVGEALKQKLTIDDDTKTLRSVFAVFVEQMQNIIRYSAEKVEAPLPPAADDARSRSCATGSSRSAGKAACFRLRRQPNRARRRRAPARAQPHQGNEQGGVKGDLQGAAARRPGGREQGRGPRLHGDRAPASKPIEFDFTDLDDLYVLRAESDI